ncbi:M1-specific T cell receptor beta chain [Lates calcarifer]|uniref:M1-specific T cell receptor beta chain n=1 Tax=Lates calcarifer TaxID=8187 RepID=UPI0021D7BD75|nr:M1-specific T cell receptor beta chain [Lates calcarifer]
MIPGITTLTFFILWTAGVSQSVTITQWPHYISRPPGGLAEIHCYQNDTDYEYLYWYKQLRGKDIQLVVVLVVGTPNFEEGFKSGFQAVKVNEKQWSLTISSVQEKDEAFYLCAAIRYDVNNYNPAYFGSGTKLTVLERNITQPTVTVFKPSLHECENKNEKGTGVTKKKTLLCVASGFYPDHVSVSWKVDGKKVDKNVSTDSAAQLDGDFYRITSRLRVPAKDWHNPKKYFQCIVSFFNGNETKHFEGSIKGEADPVKRAKYLKITQSAKLSYSVFIVKSCIYGAFVVFLVWRLQGSAGKD